MQLDERGRMGPDAWQDVITSTLNFIITGALGAGGTYIAMRLKAMTKRQDETDRRHAEEFDALKDGMMCSLQGDLVEMHRRYIVVGEPCPVTEKDRMDRTYRAYHALGGNGTGTVLWQQVMNEAKVAGRSEWRAAHPEAAPIVDYGDSGPLPGAAHIPAAY